ncbi:hypothetical protein [Sporosarcina sp. E16_8]|uniref:hypothetical protein n=1 Tax=Sporosarcina sp. E16_8 TaxID=2789295 RepID=UPI001A910AD9|nr:hypothetical protein [Sporosarcina sp. E16_8]MBO0586814.1 hypothetical protein [Sporosarcina sp. E16_8]
MYLTEPLLTDVVKKQFLHKLKAYTGVFNSLLVMQLIGIILGFGTSSGGSSSGGTLTVNYSFLTGDVPVIFTLLWAFSMGILVTTLAYRNDAFSFVSNRLSHNISSFLFLLFASVIAGTLATLAGSIIKLISSFQSDPLFAETSGLFSSPADFFIMTSTSVLYTALFASMGYVVGSFIQRSKFVLPLLIAAIFVIPLLQLNMRGQDLIANSVAFFGTETSLLLFLLKIIVTISILFAISIGVTTKTEVRK